MPWVTSLSGYYYRPEWELYDTKYDPLEVENVAKMPRYRTILERLQKKLTAWRRLTRDPWLCAPHGVLESGLCMPLNN